MKAIGKSNYQQVLGTTAADKLNTNGYLLSQQDYF